MSNPQQPEKPYTPAPLPPQMDAAPGVTPAGEATELPDQAGTSGGTWDEARGSAEIPPRAPRAPFWTPKRRRRAANVLGALIVLLLVCLFIGNLLAPSPIRSGETPAVQNLKALATAQAQYHKRYGCYADAGWRLNAAGTLIAKDLADAFEDWQGNGDSATPIPKTGCVYRMLHGEEGKGPFSFYRDPSNPAAGMNTWAATSRYAEPGVERENQYFIGEAGSTFKFTEPAAGTPQHKQFLLYRMPPNNQTTWQTAK